MFETNEINKKALKLWKEPAFKAVTDLMPLIYPDLPQGGLLTIGLNPSFREGTWSFLKCTTYADLDPNEFFKRDSNQFNIEDAIEIEKIARKRYTYFKKLRELVEHVDSDLAWAHADLFVFRKTKQEELKKAVGNENALNEFGRKQLALSRELIKGVKPIMVVVVSAVASRIFCKEFNATYEEEMGVHCVWLNNANITTLFSGMVSGQGSLDNFSYKRLKWHAKKAYKEKACA